MERSPSLPLPGEIVNNGRDDTGKVGGVRCGRNMVCEYAHLQLGSFKLRLLGRARFLYLLSPLAARVEK